MPPEENTVQQTEPGSGDTGSPEPTTTSTTTTTTQPSVEEAVTERAKFLKMVPEEFRDDPSLKDFKSFKDWVKSDIHLRRLLGREPRVPAKDDPPDAWNQFYNALGRPDTPDKYVIHAAEGEGAPEIDPEYVEGFRKIAHEIGLTQSQAARLAEWDLGFIAQRADDIAADIAAKTERAERELKREWGPQAYDGNVRLANQFAEDFGGKELIEWLETSGEGSNPLLIRAFAKAGRALSEDRLGHSRPSDFGYTPQEAQTEIGRLRMDKDFTAALYDNEHPGHAAAVERMRVLHTAAFPTEEPAP